MPTKDELNKQIEELKAEIESLRADATEPAVKMVPMFWVHPIEMVIGSTMDVYGVRVEPNDDGYHVGMIEESRVDDFRNREGKRFLTENEYTDFLEDLEVLHAGDEKEEE